MPLPARQTPTPPDLENTIPGQQRPSDPLGCAGPNFSAVQKMLTRVVGKARNSDPADPCNCAPMSKQVSLAGLSVGSSVSGRSK